ncbi:MAG: hypothetical protein HRT47_03665 [Candidatus Caenarcaniphilales bacterium]|nr:hypothetical protein [Candidatus Caenarcaniphilales bacterium]
MTDFSHQTLNLDESLKVLELAANNLQFLNTLTVALDREKNYEQGIKLTNSEEHEVTIKAYINGDTGLWEFILELPHGNVYYEAHNKAITKLTISTVFNENLIDLNTLSYNQVGIVLEEMISSIDVDLEDSNSIFRLKDFAQNDFVLRYLNFDASVSKENQFLVHITKLRKEYLSYFKKYSFLWSGTCFNSATHIVDVMKEQKLLA